MADMDAILRAIRQKCMDCCGRSKVLVERCAIKQCALWPYRMYQGKEEAKRTGRESRQEQLRMTL